MELNFIIVSIAHKEGSGRENLSGKTKVIHLLTRCLNLPRFQPENQSIYDAVLLVYIKYVPRKLGG